jgi:hypothetical protein
MPALFCARLLSSLGFFQHADYLLLIFQYPLKILFVLLLQMSCKICVAFLRQVALVIECLKKNSEEQSAPCCSQHVTTAAAPAPVKRTGVVRKVRAASQIRRCRCRSDCINNVLGLVDLGNLPVCSLEISVSVCQLVAESLNGIILHKLSGSLSVSQNALFDITATLCHLRLDVLRH